MVGNPLPFLWKGVSDSSFLIQEGSTGEVFLTVSPKIGFFFFSPSLAPFQCCDHLLYNLWKLGRERLAEHDLVDFVVEI